jgi:hypothetical protein
VQETAGKIGRVDAGSRGVLDFLGVVAVRHGHKGRDIRKPLAQRRLVATSAVVIASIRLPK